MIGDIEAADRWTVEYEAQQRAARGPTIVEGEEPTAPSYTPEELAEARELGGLRVRLALERVVLRLEPADGFANRSRFTFRGR